MSASALPLFAPLLGLLGWAAAVDLRSRRIPNVISVALAASGLFQSFLPYHTVLPAQAAAGLAAGFGLGLVLWLLGVLGGGDVKLLAGVGAWMGCPRVLTVFVVTALVGLVIVLVQALWRRRLGTLLRNSFVLILNLISRGESGVTQPQAAAATPAPGEKPLPYAVPVLAATLLVLLSPNLKWL